MYSVIKHENGIKDVERYESLTDAANIFSIEVGGEEITNTPNAFHCVGAGPEVEQDYAEFGTLIVAIPELDYTCILKSDNRWA